MRTQPNRTRYKYADRAETVKRLYSLGKYTLKQISEQTGVEINSVFKIANNVS